MGSYVSFLDGFCLKQTVDNCELPPVARSAAKCLRCAKDYVLDTATGKCKKVATPIDNCDRYGASASCQLCREGYYLSGKACTAVATDKLVADCVVYDTASFACLQCKAGHYMNAATGACEPIPAEDNCMAYTQNRCLSCASGYVTDQNHRLSLGYDADFMKQLVTAAVDGGSRALLVNANLNNCKKATVPNCAEFETFDKCSACKAGYLLTNNGTKCAFLPQEPIQNCLVYADATTCTTCAFRSFKDGAECKASAVVDHCEAYSQTQDECATCQSGYYLDAGACRPRDKTKASAQCKELHQEKDECLACKPGFILDTDKTRCLANAPHCQDNAVDADDNVTCAKCAEGYGRDAAGLC